MNKNPQCNRAPMVAIAGDASSRRELFELELRIARRADELARTAVRRRDRNLESWLQAEREVMVDGAALRQPAEKNDREE